MTYAAKVVTDSIADGVRLTTMEVTFPRFILAEFNTHRVFSRNSASSRAIPVERRIVQVRENPFVPESFSKSRRGMQADGGVEDHAQAKSRHTWLLAAEAACVRAEELVALGVHKQHANRLLEPFVWHTVVVSSTEWENFFNLRIDKNAQPEMQITARLMREAYDLSRMWSCQPGDWHLPYVEQDSVGSDAALVDELKGLAETTTCAAAIVSVVRCAAVSYERQHADRTLASYVERHNEMIKLGHWSPFEHQAQVRQDHPMLRVSIPYTRGVSQAFYGNFRAPWLQYRKLFEGEAVWRPR